MQYLTYLFNNYIILFLRLTFFVTSAIYLYSFAFFGYKITKLFKLMINPNWIFLLAIFLPVFLISLFLAGVTERKFVRYCLSGNITDVYFLDNGKQTRLIVWYTMEHERYTEEYYSNRLKSFDLKSGKKISSLDLNYYYKQDDYHIYGFYDDRYAWGYTEQKGVQLLDLFDLEVIIDSDQIRKLNPQLGDVYKLAPGKVFNKKDHSLLFSNNQGSIIRILPEYNKKLELDHVNEILPKPDNSLKNSIDIKKYFKHKKARIYTIFEQDNETLVFVTIGGYTLSALRVDAKTKEVLGRIDYF